MRYFFNRPVPAMLVLVTMLGSISQAFAQNIPVLTQTAPAGSVTQPYTPANATPQLNNTGYNYFRTYVPKRRIAETGLVEVTAAPEDVAITTTFKDGFYRPVETTVRNFTHTSNPHLVIPHDGAFNAGKSYSLLPYARNLDYASANLFNVTYPGNTVQLQQDYYAARFPGEGKTAFSSLQNISDAQTRGSKSLLPGKSHVGQGRGASNQLISNDAAAVPVWEVDAAGLPVVTGHYPQNTLYGTQATDAEQGSATSFYDKTGRLIMKRQKLADAGVPDAITYYVYDGLDRLAYTLTPKAVALIGTGTSVSQATLDNLCYQYFYDDRERLVAFHQPGIEGNVQFVYDRYHRIVMRQNPMQKEDGAWEIIFHDRLGRTIATSLYKSVQSRAYWQSLLDVPPGSYGPDRLEYYLATGEGEGVYPGEHAISDNTMLTYTYFDSYGTMDATEAVYDFLQQEQLFNTDLLDLYNAELPVKSERVHGLKVGSKVRILKSESADADLGDWQYNYYYYDDKGRVIGTVSFDKLSGQAPLSYQRAQLQSLQYDFLNRVILTKHTSVNKDAIAGQQVYPEWVKPVYDNKSGLLTNVYHKIGSSPWSILSKNEYDELGNVKRYTLGNNGEVQDISYNIRGDLTGINALYAETGNREGRSKTFGQSLKYDYGFSKPSMDGKIAGMVWRGAGDANAKMMAYGYSYDAAGRMTSADFREMTATGWSNTATDYTVSNVSYDIAGSIRSMKQRGVGFVNGVATPVDMDRLSYSYDPSGFRLASVRDTVAVDYNLGDFVDRNTNGNDYEYDKNGRLTKDRNKQIALITYNVLNKPEVIRMESGARIEMSYYADGGKLEELIIAGDQLSRTDYAGNFVYRNDSLQFAYTSTGRSILLNETDSFKEEFFVKDYLGNVRSVVDVFTYDLLEYFTSFEVASAHIDQMTFDFISEVRDIKPGSSVPDDQSSGRLHGADPERQIGAALILKVMAGDRIEMNVNNFYEGFDHETDQPVSPEQMLSTIISTLTTGNGGFAGSESHDVGMVDKLFNESNFVEKYSGIVQATQDYSRPKSGLNYIVYDDAFEATELTGAFQADGDGAWSTLGTSEPMEITHNGYIAIFLDNRSAVDVYYDQVTIRLTKGALREEKHYYPYGLPMGNIGSAAAGFMANRHRYQGNENITDLGVNLMDFDHRQYDAQLGIFRSVDPLALLLDHHNPYAGMGNDPVHHIDPSGLSPGAVSGAVDGGDWHFNLHEIVIYGSGRTGIIYNPGGGISPSALYDPWRPRGGASGDWGMGGNGTSKRNPHPGNGGLGGWDHGNNINGANNIDSEGGRLGGRGDGGVNGSDFDSEREGGYELPGAAPNGDEDAHGGGSADGWISWSFMKTLHQVMDYVEAVPVVGNYVAGVNAMLYLAEGDYFSASMSAAAIIPGGALIGKLGKGAKLAKKGSKLAAKGGKELFNFSTKAAEHMANPGRAVPVQILEQAIKGSKGLADPRGSRALMHTTEMFKNGKAYNLEVLYDKATNSIWHFKYSPIKP